MWLQHGMPPLFLYIFSSHCRALDGTAALPFCYCYCDLLRGWVAAGQLQMGIKGIQAGELFLEVDDARGHVRRRLGRHQWVRQSLRVRPRVTRVTLRAGHRKEVARRIISARPVTTTPDSTPLFSSALLLSSSLFLHLPGPAKQGYSESPSLGILGVSSYPHRQTYSTKRALLI